MIHRIFWGNWQMNVGLAIIGFTVLMMIMVMLGAWTHGTTGVVVTPPTCSNQSLNFTDPCNSGYVAAGVV